MSQEPGDLRPGEAVVCRVVQTSTISDIVSGARIEIESCRR